MPHISVTLPPLLALMRPHQWSKNVLLFCPMVMAHRMFEADLFLITCLAVLCFSLTASAVYVLNDLLDVVDDRQHPDKKNRPLASGRIPLARAPWISLGLLVLALVPSFLFLPRLFTALLVLYFCANLLYSTYLKRMPVLDTVLLTLMFVSRIYAGGLAGGVPVTNMLLSFSFFFFLSIAFAKRVQELQMTAATDPAHTEKIRGYFIADLAFLRQLGLSCGLISVLVLALYMESEIMIAHYRSPLFLWALCPLMLYWIGRFWLITLRGNMNSDPILFTLRDPVSYGVILLILAVVETAYWF